MRIFISSTSWELEPLRDLACEIVRDLGHRPVLRDRAGRRGLDAVTACRRRVAQSDGLLAIVGRRLGEGPSVAEGGDDLHPWSFFEVRAAFDHGKPVAALLAGDTYARGSTAGQQLPSVPGTREQLPEARAALLDFRGELGRLGEVFETESQFRDGVRVALQRLVPDTGAAAIDAQHGEVQAEVSGLRVRRFDPAALPGQPYPLLLPYTHPALLAGRDGDLADLRTELSRPVPLLGLHAVSGTGKCSFLAGGIVPSLRSEGRPVAFDRHPAEPGLVRRLLADLVEGEGLAADETSPRQPDHALLGGHAFVDKLVLVRKLAEGRPPILVLDQFEEILGPDGWAARAELGPLLAASAQRLPGFEDPPCRWLLAYRRDFHGQLLRWLGDVLREARFQPQGESAIWRPALEPGSEAERKLANLPHDLSKPTRFGAWALRPVATPSPDSPDPLATAKGVFLEAIEKPLRIWISAGGVPDPGPRQAGPEEDQQTREMATSRQAYPWVFAPGHAERLAGAFAEARLQRPEAPLVPELQVVLAFLLDRAENPALELPLPGVPELALPPVKGPSTAGEPPTDGCAVVTVPEEPSELIGRALEEHLRRALELAFPHTQRPGERSDRSRADRTRALLMLRELASTSEGRPSRQPEDPAAEIWSEVLGGEGKEVFEKLSTPRTRLVLPEYRGGAMVYVLAHQRLAEVIRRVVDEGHWSGLGIDTEILGLRRSVALKSRLFAAGDTDQATFLSRDELKTLETHREVLIWSEAHRAWWQACRQRYRLAARRRIAWQAVALALSALVAFSAWTAADRGARRRALLAEVAMGDPEAAFAAFDALIQDPRAEPEVLLERLRSRERPFDIFELGLGGVETERRAESLVRAAEVALPILEADPRNPVLIASLVWALDFFSGDTSPTRDFASSLRERALRPLRRERPPPPLPAPGAEGWSDIPAGSFSMGADPDADRSSPRMRDEYPRHVVTLSAYRMATHETTNAEYRRLIPDHPGRGLPGPADHPAV